jgi:hypothetical protein
MALLFCKDASRETIFASRARPLGESRKSGIKANQAESSIPKDGFGA